MLFRSVCAVLFVCCSYVGGAARADAPAQLACFDRNLILATAEELGGRHIDADFFARVDTDLTRDAHGYRLRVTVSGATRETHVGNCREGVRAAALIVALAFDDAAIDHGDDLVLRIEEEPTALRHEDPPAAPTTPPVLREVSVRSSDVLEPRKRTLWLSVRCGAELLISPRPLGSIDVSIGAVFGRLRASLGAVAYSNNDVVSTEPGVAIAEQRYAGRARVAYAIWQSELFEFGVGLGAEVGVLNGTSRGLRVAGATQASGAYSVVGLSSQFRVLPSEWFSLVASVDSGVNLSGPRFEIDGLGALEATSHFAISVLLGVEARIL